VSSTARSTRPCQTYDKLLQDTFWNLKSKLLGFSAHEQLVLNELREASVPSDSVRFIKDNWRSKKPDSLERRLSHLLQILPTAIFKPVDPGTAELSLYLCDRACQARRSSARSVLPGRAVHLSGGMVGTTRWPWAALEHRSPICSCTERARQASRQRGLRLRCRQEHGTGRSSCSSSICVRALLVLAASFEIRKGWVGRPCAQRDAQGRFLAS
jgi:hypothetical protein